MNKDQFRSLINKFKERNKNSFDPNTLGIENSEYKVILNAYEEVGIYSESVYSSMRSVSVFLIDSGISKEEFMKLTGYTESTTKKMFSEKNSRANTKRKNDDLECICREFNLKKDKTIKEQWFK